MVIGNPVPPETKPERWGTEGAQNPSLMFIMEESRTKVNESVCE
jgi:hypothetical protein